MPGYSRDVVACFSAGWHLLVFCIFGKLDGLNSFPKVKAGSLNIAHIRFKRNIIKCYKIFIVTVKRQNICLL